MRLTYDVAKVAMRELYFDLIRCSDFKEEDKYKCYIKYHFGTTGFVLKNLITEKYTHYNTLKDIDKQLEKAGFSLLGLYYRVRSREINNIFEGYNIKVIDPRPQKEDPIWFKQESK